MFSNCHVRTLAVPVRRNADDVQVIKGKALFLSVGCAKCHIPDQKTKVNVSFPQLSNQLIHSTPIFCFTIWAMTLQIIVPISWRPEKEWRTATLWGIGLTQKVNGHTNFLHDGRARNLLEAIMWHGGEAAPARNRVKNSSKADRDALISFFNSL
ncbi:di-heme oxidoredictase family protein [Hufsiella arboris]|uniref:di-heme oxidoredictase family protein n=1 Tax=Hufsiella arboris TaxID=2695275 RepID=UPI003F7238F9